MCEGKCPFTQQRYYCSELCELSKQFETLGLVKCNCETKRSNLRDNFEKFLNNINGIHFICLSPVQHNYFQQVSIYIFITNNNILLQIFVIKFET